MEAPSRYEKPPSRQNLYLTKNIMPRLLFLIISSTPHATPRQNSSFLTWKLEGSSPPPCLSKKLLCRSTWEPSRSIPTSSQSLGSTQSYIIMIIILDVPYSHHVVIKPWFGPLGVGKRTSIYAETDPFFFGRRWLPPAKAVQPITGTTTFNPRPHIMFSATLHRYTHLRPNQPPLDSSKLKTKVFFQFIN
ncbi:hypothetical protein E3N88_20046 [Mikania micrantha]|uniref:Uncharacterized protein n=1 Tax=Mikania micrantha TaxID=192012 RepID=A0A5N6NHR9_9ASTR|nr:hypothetical protein E3N88_20046 [Mikania micrantha]